MPRDNALSNDQKKNMIKNIIKHRKTLFHHLETIDDTVLKHKIKFYLRNSKKLDSSINHKKKHELKIRKEIDLNTSKLIPRLGKVKEESIDLYSENSDEFLSVESNDEWYGSYSTSDEIDGDSKRRSNKLNINSWNDDSKNTYVHDVDVIIFNHLKDVEIRTNQNASSELSPLETPTSKKESLVAPPRFRAPIDRDLHNAKERECRERIRKMFMDLAIHCSQLNNTRRIPSKHSILIAAKRECEMQKSLESKLLLEKAVWIQSNEMLRDKLKIVRDSIVNGVV